MRSLEAKIPPPLVAALLMFIMWASSYALPEVTATARVRVGIAVIIALVGLSFSVAGAVSFRIAKTTVNPLHPNRASKLVTSGVFKISRNPMYLALALLITAWAAYLASPVLVLGPIAFIAYITHWQIKPEERALSSLFGAEYTQYMSRVRRWL